MKYYALAFVNSRESIPEKFQCSSVKISLGNATHRGEDEKKKKKRG